MIYRDQIVKVREYSIYKNTTDLLKNKDQALIISTFMTKKYPIAYQTMSYQANKLMNQQIHWRLRSDIKNAE